MCELAHHTQRVLEMICCTSMKRMCQFFYVPGTRQFSVFADVQGRGALAVQHDLALQVGRVVGADLANLLLQPAGQLILL